jgi:hypothetical protein
MVIVRRHGFSNDQWVLEGANLLELKYRGAGPLAADPSQRIRPNGCGIGPLRPIDEVLARLPREGFDYLWLIDPPAYDQRLVGDMQIVWRGPGTILYRTRK